MHRRPAGIQQAIAFLIFHRAFNSAASKIQLFHFNFAWAGEHLIQFTAIMFSFFVDLFDTVGTVVGVADKAGLLDKDTNLRVGRVFMSDAIGTVAGACLGTSTITSFVESSAGVAAGGRTGLFTALTTGILFLVSLVFSPFFLAIPGFATAPALCMLVC